MTKAVLHLGRQAKFLLSFVVVLLAVQLFYSEPVLAALIIVLFTFFLTGIMPSSNQNLRVVLAFAHVTIGFFVYLLIRGVFRSNPIDSADLPISVAFITLTTLSLHLLLSSNRRISFLPLDTRFFGGSAALAVSIVFVTHLYTKGQGYFLAWAGSGDSRNHVQWAFSIASQGGISAETLLFPQLTTALSVMLASGNTTNLFDDSSARLTVDLTSAAMTWVILIGFLGYAFSATWEEVLSKSKMSRATKSWLLMPISLAAISSLSLGTYMRDGFISALTGSIAIAIAIAFLLDKTKLLPNQQIFVIGIVLLFAILSWTLLIIPVSLLMIPRYFTWMFEGLKSKVIVKILLTITFLALGIYVFLIAILAELKTTLLLPGSITAPDQKLFYLSLLSILVLALLSSERFVAVGSKFLIIFVAMFSSMLIVKEFSGLGIFEQNYYSSKFLTILIIGLLPLLFLFIPIAALSGGIIGLQSKARIPLASLLIAVIIFQSLEFFSPFPKLWRSINSGWVQPNAQTTSLVVSLPNDPDNPTVLFKFHPDDPGSTRLGDFWLGTYANPIEPYQSWSYVGNQEGDMKGFCALNEGYPKMTVLTRDPNLSTRMFAHCPKENVEILFIR